MTTFDKIQIATQKSNKETKRNYTIEQRYEILATHLRKQNLKFEDVCEKPAKGANLSIIKMKGKYRVNYRCGYSRNNYAPCVEILDED